MAVKFHFWLAIGHPDILEALEAIEAFEPILLEAHITLHSATYEALEAANPEDGTRIRWQIGY